SARDELSLVSGELVAPLTTHHSPPSRNDLLLSCNVIPHHVAIQFSTCDKEHAALRRLSHIVSEPHIFRGLVPARQEEDVDRHAFAGAQLGLAQGCRLGERIGRIDHPQNLSLEMSRGKTICNDNYLPIGCVLDSQIAASEVQAMLNVGEMGRHEALAY